MLASLTDITNGVIVFLIGVVVGGVATLFYREVILGWFKGGRG